MSIPVRWIKGWPADDILNFRILSALVSLWVFILLFRIHKVKQDINTFTSQKPQQRRRVLVLTFLCSVFIFGNWYTYIYAINNISVQSAAFGYLICPLITTFAARVILKEALTPLKWLALGIAFISACLLATGSLIEVAWSFAIALLYALYLIIQRSVKGYDKLNSLAVQLTICSIFIIPILFIQGHPVPQGYIFWSTIVLIAVLFTIIPLFLSMYALTGISSSTTGVLLYVNPIIAFVLAIFYFHEPVSPQKYMAYTLLFFAIALFNAKPILSLFKSKTKNKRLAK